MTASKPYILVVGARPNFMKIAPLYREMEQRGLPLLLLHTGQHYDEKMSTVFFNDLGMPKPDIYLGIGSDSHANQTAKIMMEFDQVCDEHDPRCVVVVGDVNSTIACALVAAKRWIPVAHVEAGLRSRDWRMPEEVNRVVTDRLSDLLLTPSSDGNENLLAEGTASDKIHLVGNIMIDTLFQHLDAARETGVVEGMGLAPGGYGLLTLHRPSNVDEEETFRPLVKVLMELSEELPLVFPIHPRTKARAEAFGLLDLLEQNPRIHLAPPLGYLEFQGLVGDAKMVLTDSGGLQEETTALGIPCLTLRENTERPITVTEGTNTVVGSDPDAIRAGFNSIMTEGGKAGRVPALWDGKTAGRITDVLMRYM
jgi:UDP-N-acetylglucosamine 2-epimerase (non-hydrolysing)